MSKVMYEAANRVVCRAVYDAVYEAVNGAVCRVVYEAVDGEGRGEVEPLYAAVDEAVWRELKEND